MKHPKPHPIPLVPELEDEEETGQEFALEQDEDGLVPPEGIEVDEDHERVANMPD